MAKKYKDKYKLDAYEQEIEDNLEFSKPVENEKELLDKLAEAAIEHVKKKK